MPNDNDRGHLWFWYAIAVVVVLLDQLTKTAIMSHFVYGDSLSINAYFNVVRVHNAGAAFSFLSDAGGWQRWALSGLAALISAVMVVWIARLSSQKWLERLALALILGGALGNLWDRLTLGYVVDFLDFHWSARHFPAFNVADSAITIGAVLMLIDAWCTGDTGADDSDKRI
jgi:signal peptidase II